MRDRWMLGVAWRSGFTACLASAATARGAEPRPGVELEWIAPSGCPDEASARNAIAGYLGHRQLEASKPLVVRVEIAAAPGGRWRAELSVGGGASGDRRLEGTSCGRVSDAAALIVALMLDPVEVVTQMEAPRAEPRRVTPEPAGERSGIAANGRITSRAEIGLQAGGDVGSLPEPTVGVGLVAGLRLGRALLGVDVGAWVPRRAFRGPTAASGGEIGLYTASLRGCFMAVRAVTAGVGLEPCLRAEGGLSTGRGFGIAEPASSQNPWGAAFLGVSIRQLSTDSLTAWLSVEGGLSFWRPTYVIEDLGTVFRAGPLLGRASLGMAWSFP